MTIDSKDSRYYDNIDLGFTYTKKARSQSLVTRSPCIGLRIAPFVETSNANTSSNLMQHLKR